MTLNFLPERSKPPRETGLTMMMDKGLSVSQLENFLETSSDFTDIVKFGFGTAVVSKNLKPKIELLKQFGIRPYFGGTLFELYYVRGQIEDYFKFVDELKIDLIEISDGSIIFNHDEKCELIHKYSSNYTVLSEVGSKEEGIIVSPGKWIKMMSNELEAGSWKVIAEGRESGSVGIFRPNGNPHTMLINKIISKVDPLNILWESPTKKQQTWFINLFDQNVNLGNIAPNDVLPLETLRLGLRGDTFFNYIPENIINQRKPQQ
jgi:phosphosulfolactate synthase